MTRATTARDDGDSPRLATSRGRVKILIKEFVQPLIELVFGCEVSVWTRDCVGAERSSTSVAGVSAARG
jgi:hypothetical protein